MSQTKPCPKCATPNTAAVINCVKCGERLPWADAVIAHRAAAQQTAQNVAPGAQPGIIVTTGDLKEPYQIIGPIYFQVSNKGVFSSQLSKLVKQYRDEIEAMRAQGQVGAERVDWGFLYGQWSVGQTDFEKAFFVAVEELKKRAKMVGADAIIGMRQDIDLDTNTFQYFYLQMYGTAVRFRRPVL